MGDIKSHNKEYKKMNINNTSLANVTRKDFPMFCNVDNANKNLIYLDHAATSQKPFEVIQTLKDYYSKTNANVHRGAHQLSSKATEAFENARDITSNFINAYSSKEIVFTRNATEAINLISHSWGNKNLKEGDEILLTLMEHHSNLVPWQLLSERCGCKLQYVGLTPNGELDISDLKNKINSRTKLISLVHISNTLGCLNPIEEISQIAKSYNTLILLDACQSLAHQPIDIRKLNIDFLAGSSHKLCGPTGMGFLWGREKHLEAMDPFLGGGEMIEDVYLEKSSWSNLPHKFEAGTPAIGEAIGMGAAIKYLESIGLENIHEWEKKITNYLFKNLKEIDNIHILGPSPEHQEKRGALATFYIEDIHSNDISELLDLQNICIRSGHHCCQPLHRFYGIKSSARASLSFTNTIEEIDIFSEELKKSIKFIKRNS